ncbi:hypothetical protein GobsT_41690 [Gemmata obscuriglobus]|uniref:Pre-peptidase n=1 Tax=Gemmata obscuriglobus TaxID=114 RepID=A0A2Z3H2L9_9BACT|nr:PPC domain-containing protein [Gemmata obscuriglobus]AWM37806.1 pre-peptidase [Gemmata obscuriglobus]QEG29373.1 hypothetical protein GobsT_41690 [Gemmata obscuriglobus]VTS08419.1 Putative pre-peptidase OS=Singulisphaera acidiphila (strain ATCC BAA-1392 / DSM 18658 / VKM B-2454 / MOB10) GN=Sinac_2823 PE=4 SV=1: PPC [Gemmata obscuriglobus UQM 2246]
MSASTIRSFQLSAFSLFVLCTLCGEKLFSAPPAITYLSPAGAQQGTTVEVTAAGLTEPTARVWVSGKGVSAENVKGKLKITVAKDAVPDVYWLRAHSAEGASGLRPFIVGVLPEVTEKEPNDEFKKAQLIEATSVVVNGKLEKSGDVDCFAVRLKKGQTLVASLDAHNALRSPVDAMMQVLSADGFVLDENNDFHGLDPQIAFTAKKDGVHVVRVYAFPATPDSTIRYFGSDASVYRLTLTTGPFADHTTPLAVQNGTAAVETEGWNLSPETRKFALTYGLPDSPFALAAGRANAVRVRVEPHPTFGPKTSEPLKPPFSVTDRIEKAGTDVSFIMNAKKGQSLTIQVESRTVGLAVNPVVRVLDADKKQLARAEPPKINADTALAFNAPADGAYTVTVGDQYAGSGPRHAFLLRVLSEPDYDLTVPADHFTVAPGTPTTIAVKVNRKLGFTKPVEVSAQGLPPGVKVTIVQPAKPDPNTVTLSLSANEPLSVPFRLIGTVKDLPSLTRYTRFTAPEFDEPLADLWLTVTAPKK